MAEKLYAEILDASQKKVQQLRKEKTHRWQSQIKPLPISDGKKLWLSTL